MKVCIFKYFFITLTKRITVTFYIMNLKLIFVKSNSNVKNDLLTLVSDDDPIELLEENKKLVKTYKAIWIIVVVIVFLLLLLVIDLIWFRFALRGKNI